MDFSRIQVLPDGRLSRSNAAKLLGRQAKTLAEWSSKGIGPRPIRSGGRVFYDYNECLSFARGGA
ncbi:MAG: DNA-binding protein [Rhizorhabdus sp.]|nr:DNA-binding protein [Rhizorhabdus sp.]